MSRPKEGQPTAAEFGALRAFLARAGLSPADLDQALGPAPAGRTRAQLAAALRSWLRDRPRTDAEG